ncbi:MAG: hypothetical protein HKN36_00825 [Hellea sp.]|nr:hypothetical protein [Hellea sp.]
MTQLAGTNSLRINRHLDNDQLLVKLCRNGKEWLSPVGWVRSQKGTLLDCRRDKQGSIVEIPAEFARKLNVGDTLELINSESAFKASINWGEAGRISNGAARPASVKTPEVSLIETEKRAAEAQKVADAYKAKMDAAAQAREAAQAAALEAARLADEALKAETDRIEEMELAAAAFEEAKRFKRDEERRLEKERVAEEARIAEEARLAEENKIKEAAARLEAKRDQARKLFQDEIDKIEAQKAELQKIVDEQNAQLQDSEAAIAQHKKALTRTEKTAAKAQEQEACDRAALQDEDNHIASLKVQRQKLAESLTEIDRSNDRLFKNLAGAEQAYQQAEEEVVAAQARAADSLKALEKIKSESGVILPKKAALQKEAEGIDAKLGRQESQLSGLKQSWEKARQSYEDDEAAIRDLKDRLDTEQARTEKVRANIARAEADMRAVDEKLSDKQAMLSRVNETENAEQIRELTADVEGAEASMVAKTSITSKADSRSKEGPGFLGRFFRKEPEAAKPATLAAPPLPVKAKSTAKETPEPVPVREPAIAAEPILAPELAPVKLDAAPKIAKSPAEIQGPIVKHSEPKTSSARPGFVLVFTVVLIGAAAFGLYALSKIGSSASSQSAASQTAVPETTMKTPEDSVITQTASLNSGPSIDVDTNMIGETDNISDPAMPETIDGETTPVQNESETGPSKAAPANNELEPPLMEAVTEPIEQTVAEAEPKISQPETIIQTETIAAPTTRSAAARYAPVNTKPSSPNPYTIAEAETAPVQPIAVRPISETTTPVIIQPSPVYRRDAAPAIESLTGPQSDPAMIRTIQDQLAQLGFYGGEINGLQTAETQDAIQLFKTLFELPVNSDLTDEFRAELSQVVYQRQIAPTISPAGSTESIVQNPPADPVPIRSEPSRNKPQSGFSAPGGFEPPEN